MTKAIPPLAVDMRIQIRVEPGYGSVAVMPRSCKSNPKARLSTSEMENS